MKWMYDEAFDMMLSELRTMLVVAESMSMPGFGKKDICWKTGLIPSLNNVIAKAEQAKEDKYA